MRLPHNIVVSVLFCGTVVTMMTTTMTSNVPSASETETNAHAPPTLAAASTPVIGILSQPLIGSSNNETYIAASYVKWLEVGGARSIPIPYDASPVLVRDILTQVDGVLFPGGGAPVPPSAKEVWRLLRNRYYSKMDFVPMWGTCLGMEFIVQLACNNFDDNDSILDDGYVATNVSLPLLHVKRDGLYRPDDIYNAVVRRNLTMNNHHLGIHPDVFRNTEQLSKHWKITSTNVDLNGKPFVSTMEPLDKTILPIYGVQFHPEKNAFEYGLYPNSSIPYEAIDHSSQGIAMSIHMATYFVNMARENILALERSVHRNINSKYTKADVYPMVYTYPHHVGFKFEERYIIPPASTWEGRMPNYGVDTSPIRRRANIQRNKHESI